MANKTESSGKETISLITDKLNNAEKRAAEKRQSLNAENAKLKAKLQEQQRRVEHSKAEHQKRRKEQEKAAQSYQKFKEKTDNVSVVEGDKLRVQSLDKEALSERSKLEYNRQVRNSFGSAQGSEKNRSYSGKLNGFRKRTALYSGTQWEREW